MKKIRLLGLLSAFLICFLVVINSLNTFDIIDSNKALSLISLVCPFFFVLIFIVLSKLEKEMKILENNNINKKTN